MVPLDWRSPPTGSFGKASQCKNRQIGRFLFAGGESHGRPRYIQPAADQIAGAYVYTMMDRPVLELRPFVSGASECCCRLPTCVAVMP